MKTWVLFPLNFPVGYDIFNLPYTHRGNIKLSHTTCLTTSNLETSIPRTHFSLIHFPWNCTCSYHPKWQQSNILSALNPLMHGQLVRQVMVVVLNSGSPCHLKITSTVLKCIVFEHINQCEHSMSFNPEVWIIHAREISTTHVSAWEGLRWLHMIGDIHTTIKSSSNIQEKHHWQSWISWDWNWQWLPNSHCFTL